MAIALEAVIKVWSNPKYKNVMLPGLGALTCSQVADLIATSEASALREERDALKKALEEAMSALEPFAKEYERIERAYVDFPQMYNDSVTYLADRLNLGMLKAAYRARSLTKPARGE